MYSASLLMGSHISPSWHGHQDYEAFKTPGFKAPRFPPGREENPGPDSGQQAYCPGPLDLAGNLPVHFRRYPGYPTWKNLPRLRSELGQNLRVLIAHLVYLEVETFPSHPLVCLSKGNPTLLGLWLTHGQSLAEFAMKRPALEVVVEFYLLQTTRCPKTLLIAGRHVTGWRLAFRLRFGAF